MDTYRGLVRGQLSRMERRVMSALIVIEVHARDVLDGLVAAGTTSVNDFDWISQLRSACLPTTNNTQALQITFLFSVVSVGCVCHECVLFCLFSC